MIQVWSINVLVMRSRGRTEKSQNGQKQHRTKGLKDKNQNGQNPKRWNILIWQQSRCTIPHDTGTWYMIQVRTINVLVVRSRGRTEKSQNGQKQHITKGPKDKNQSGQKPPKRGNVLIQQQSRCTIPWSHDTGVDNQRSRHVITWVDREKPKWTKAA